MRGVKTNRRADGTLKGFPGEERIPKGGTPK